MSVRDDMSFAIAFTQALGKWVRGHKTLNKALPDGKWLFEMYVRGNDRYVIVNLKHLNYPYYAKFIEPDEEAYCLQLLRVVEQKVFNLISCEIKPYTIRFEFMARDRMIIKHVRYSFASMIY